MYCSLCVAAHIQSYVMLIPLKIFSQELPLRKITENYSVHKLDHYRTEYDYDNCLLGNVEVERLLSKLKLSASGCDDTPAWLLRTCVYELADTVAHIITSDKGGGICFARVCLYVCLCVC